MEKIKTYMNVTITLFFFYKNTLYKNKEAQNDPKFRNNLRTTPASKYAKFLEHEPEDLLISKFLEQRV